MRLLLDTHVFLWWLQDPGSIRDEAHRAVAEARNIVFVSAVSYLEIVLKEATGKLTVNATLEKELHSCRFTELPVNWAHVAALRALPTHHKDPFDRLLIAQAKAEGLTLVTRDPAMSQYDVPVLPA